MRSPPVVRVRYRAISVREDVYELLVRLSSVNNMSMSDLIRELLTAYLAMGEVREMLRQCLNNLGRQTTTQVVTQPTNTHETVKGTAEPTETPLVGFEDNPWVQIIRAKVVGNEDSEGR